MSADKIIQKIMEKAETDVQEIREEARIKQEKRIEAINAQTEKMLLDIKEQEAEAIEEVYRRSTLMTRLEIRKNELALKRELVEKAFAEARRALDQLDDDAYIRLITRIVTEGVVTGDETLLVPKGVRSRYTGPFKGSQSMMDLLRQALRDAGKPDTLVLADEDAPFEGGVMLSGSSSDVNGSYDMLIAQVQDRDEREVYKQLFEVEV